jgi:hypothetical protein
LEQGPIGQGNVTSAINECPIQFKDIAIVPLLTALPFGAEPGRCCKRHDAGHLRQRALELEVDEADELTRGQLEQLNANIRARLVGKIGNRPQHHERVGNCASQPLIVLSEPVIDRHNELFRPRALTISGIVLDLNQIVGRIRRMTVYGMRWKHPPLLLSFAKPAARMLNIVKLKLTAGDRCKGSHSVFTISDRKIL